jgi:hypothetical protein
MAAAFLGWLFILPWLGLGVAAELLEVGLGDFVLVISWMYSRTTLEAICMRKLICTTVFPLW